MPVSPDTAPPPIKSVPGVAEIERIDGKNADRSVTPRLLVEVPHGADQRVHYDALRARLKGALPDDLHEFFHVNTDVGAWPYGRRIAERVVEAVPTASALVVRCLLPRTFVDTNRVIEATDQLATTGLTAAIPSYVKDPDDIALLRGLHRDYEALVERAYRWICDGGGFALSPHTYGPTSLPIPAVDDGIVGALRAAHAPGLSHPRRPEIDVITRTKDGTQKAPAAVIADVRAGLVDAGLEVIENKTYYLVESTQGYRWAMAYPDRFLTLEVRRDLLVERWLWNEEMTPDAAKVDRIAAPLAAAIARWLGAH